MKCPSCGHDNISGFRFCEVCLTALADPRTTTQEIIGGFFDEADLIEAAPAHTSRGVAVPRKFKLPWLSDVAELSVIGRGPEIDEVTGRVAAALERRLGMLLGVRGETGSGRSRVLAAVRDAIMKAHPGTRVIVASAQGCHRPYALMERLLRLRFDIPDVLAGTIAGERFERAGEQLFGGPTGGEVARTCGPMLGFHFWAEHDIDFEDRNEQTRRATEALHTLLMHDLNEAPTVIMVDDAGDADAESVDFLVRLRPDIATLPVVVLLVAAERGVQRRPALADVDAVELAPMSDDALTKLARQALANVADVTDAAVRVLVQHAGGRPGALLAAVQALQTNGGVVGDTDGWRLDVKVLDDLVDRGELRIRPGGRYDRLSEEQREIARLAAVCGRHFWLGGIVALLRADEQHATSLEDLGRDGIPSRVAMTLNLLVDMGLMIRERSSALPLEEGFRFIDVTDVEVLRESFDAEQLRDLSHRTAEWIELVGGARSAELAEMLAPLWVACGETAHAAHLYLRAGLQALEQLRNDDARRHLHDARALSSPAAAGVHLQAMLAQGRVAEIEGRTDEAEQTYRSALGVAWSHRARTHGALALLRLGRLFRAKGQISKSLEHLVPALRLYEAVGDPDGQAKCSDDIGRAYWLSGNVRPALRFLQRAAQLHERLDDRPGLAVTLTNMGILAMTTGNVERSRAHLERAIAIRRKGKRIHGLVESLNAMGALHLNAGEVEEAVASMEEAYDLAKRVGNRRMQAMLQNNLGEVLLKSGRLAESEPLLYKAVEGAGRLEDHNLLSDASRNLALAAFQRDDGARALTWARRSVAAAQLSDVARVKAAAMGTLGEILAGSGEADAADNAFVRAEQLWVEANDRSALSACLQTHAAFLMRIGRPEKAQKVLARVDKLTRKRAPSGKHGAAPNK